MTIGIDFIGTNLGSGTKTYNINFCEEINSLSISSNIKIFICKNYLKQISKNLNQNKKIQYLVKPNFLSITFIRLIWMQLILPFELKFLGVNKLYCPMNFSPILAKFLNIKIILCLHSNLPWVYFNLMPGNIIRNFITKKLMEISIYTCDLLIFNSFFAKKELEDILNLSKKKIEVVYLGVNNIFLKNNCENNLINLFNYNERYILSVMSCVKYHNIINILKAFKLLIDDLKIDIKLVLVLQILDKKYFLEIEKFIRSNHMEKQIQIFSNLNINQLPKLYKNAELYVFTSYCEVFGLTSLEAMAKETPVVISNRSALPEVNGDAVLYFNPDEVSEIESCLKKIMLDQNLKRFLIDSGKVQYKKFDSKENVKRTIDIIEKVV
ncbi:glycosyltransferase family 4 protein [Pelagibacteraceae bacterium]|jgi:glycosyltransferase involved in cell wall biosynthesis|nr:glycosyltransferase family 4 protein [Pelagibacteraceae bacterium]